MERRVGPFQIFVGCFSAVGVVFTIIGVIVAIAALFYPRQFAVTLENILPTSTPLVITLPTQTPLPAPTRYPTHTPYPTYTPYPTSTPYPTPSPVEVMVVATPTPFATTPPGLLFFDDFDAGAHPDWETLAGDFVVANGAYTPKGTSSSDSVIAVTGYPEWRNYIVEIDVSNSESYSEAHVLVRVQDAGNFVAFQVDAWDCEWWVRKNGEWEKVPNTKTRSDIGWNYDFHQVQVTVEGNKFEAYIDGLKVSSFVDEIFPSGKVGVYLFHPVAIDNFRVSGLAGQ